MFLHASRLAFDFSSLHSKYSYFKCQKRRTVDKFKKKLCWCFRAAVPSCHSGTKLHRWQRPDHVSWGLGKKSCIVHTKQRNQKPGKVEACVVRDRDMSWGYSYQAAAHSDVRVDGV